MFHLSTKFKEIIFAKTDFSVSLFFPVKYNVMVSTESHCMLHNKCKMRIYFGTHSFSSKPTLTLLSSSAANVSEKLVNCVCLRFIAYEPSPSLNVCNCMNAATMSRYPQCTCPGIMKMCGLLANNYSWRFLLIQHLISLWLCPWAQFPK